MGLVGSNATFARRFRYFVIQALSLVLIVSTLSTISIIQKDPAATIIDMAGKRGGKTQSGRNMISALTFGFNRPSRVMWPAYNANAEYVNQNMVELVEEIERQLTVALSRSNL
jgi:hypothetical protein